MKTACAILFASLLAVPVFAGALLLEVGNPTTYREAVRNHAFLVARITACHSPEKAIVTATAEGMLNGKRASLPLRVIALSSPGAFAVMREWPERGKWAVKIIGTNPDYKDYATSVVVPIQGSSLQLESAKHYLHAPTESEVAAAIN